METNETIEALLKKQVRKEAMKRISSHFALTNEMLHRYWHELDWKEISDNSEINWTTEVIDHWKDEIDWNVLSQTSNENLLTPEMIERYKDLWDWHELSENSYLKLTYELIDKFIDRWDWKALINSHWREDTLFSLDFLKRYQQYISVENLEESALWDSIIDEAVENLKKDMIFGK